MMAMALLLEEIIESKQRIEQENPLWFWDLWAGYDWSVNAAYDLWLQSREGEPTEPAPINRDHIWLTKSSLF
jgi:hypothetical protein